MRRIWRWLCWQRVTVDEMRIDRPYAEALGWTVFAVAYVGLAAAVGLVIRAAPLPMLGATSLTADLWYVVGFKLWALLVLPMGVLRVLGYRARDLLPRWRLRPRTMLTLTLVAGLGLLLNAQHVEPISSAIAEEGAATWGLAALGVVLPLFTAALPEEVVFRGVLQTRLETVTRRPVAISVTALLFTAWHLPTRFLLASGVEGQAGDLPSVLVGTGVPVLVVGLIFGWAWDRWRSLVHLVVMHWTIDLLPSVSSMLGIGF